MTKYWVNEIIVNGSVRKSSRPREIITRLAHHSKESIFRHIRLGKDFREKIENISYAKIRWRWKAGWDKSPSPPYHCLSILVVYSGIFRFLHWNHIRAFVTNIKSLSDNCGIQVSTSADLNMWLFPPARFRFNKADARHGRPFTSFFCAMQMP